MNIGFIGLGLMGKPMAMHLEKAGHTLHLWARRAASLTPFAGLNAQTHASPAEVARHAEVVFTMVADGPDVAEVCFGEQGLVAGARPRLIVVDMSTIAPQAARDIGRRLAEHGIDFLDAPVSGGESGAIQATLTIMVGGRADVFARVEPLFACLGKTITLIGEVGAGQVAKACNQIVGAATIAAVAEALVFASRSGVDPARVRQAMLGGSAYSRVLENHGQRMLDRQFKPGFKAWMQQKDLHIVMAEAQRLGLQLPAAAMVTQVFDTLVARGCGEDDTVAAITLIEEAR